MEKIQKRRGILMLGTMLFIAAVTGCSPSASEMTESQMVTETAEVTAAMTEASTEVSTEAATEEAARNDWSYDSPENHGMDSAILEELHHALGSIEIYTSVIIKDGVIVDEYYKEGYDADSIFPLHSCSKSFTSALLGLAMEDGLIESVDEPISDYFPQILEYEDNRLKDITIRHLLTHTSGFRWDEGSGGTMFYEWRQSENWVDYVLNQRLTSDPGARFNYSTGGTHLLAAIVQQAVGKDLYEYGKERIFDPLGMDSVEWDTDPQGITDGGNGIKMNVYDMAKFGQLFLNGGEWNGEQIIPADWVEECTRVQFARSNGRASYGYQWWRRSFGRKSYDTFFAQGYAGQLIFVVPELNLVSVFTSDCGSNTHAPWDYFADYVLAACGNT